MQPYTIFQAQADHDCYGCVTQVDGDRQALVVFDDEEEAEAWPIIALGFDGRTIKG